MEVNLDIKSTGMVDIGLSCSEEYVITLTIAQNFWANHAQYRRAEKAAVELLAQHLYRDVLSLMPQLKCAINGGLRSDALRIINEMERVMRP
jgi:hypothetical protein